MRFCCLLVVHLEIIARPRQYERQFRSHPFPDRTGVLPLATEERITPLILSVSLQQINGPVQLLQFQVQFAQLFGNVVRFLA